MTDRDGVPRHAPPLPRLAVLRALDVAFADPRRLVDAIGGADDDEQATEAVSREFGLTRPEARVVLDQQFRLLTRVRTAERRRELAAGGNDRPDP